MNKYFASVLLAFTIISLRADDTLNTLVREGNPKAVEQALKNPKLKKKDIEEAMNASNVAKMKSSGKNAANRAVINGMLNKALVGKK